MKNYPVVICLAALLLFQDVRLAEVRGEVRDMQSRPIAGADVVYSNSNNGKVYRFKTDANGQYHAIGLQLGKYKIEITGPTGKRIYSGEKFIPDENRMKVSVLQIDLSVLAPQASLAPFKGPRADEKKEAWDRAIASGKTLHPEELAELRADNALISRYNEIIPETQAAIKAQDWTHAADLLAQMIEIAPYKWELYQNQGVILRNLGRFEESVQAFEHAFSIVSDDPDAKKDRRKLNNLLAQMFLNEGESLAGLEKLDEAAARFRKSAELASHPAMAYLHLCTTEYNNGQADAAVAACQKAIAAEPGHAENYQVLAGVLSNLERYQEAIHAYEKGIAVAQDNMTAARPSPKSNINSRQFADPSRARAEGARAGQMMQSAGNLYFLLKNYPRAAELFRNAASLHPYPALPLFNLCATLYDMNNFTGAAQACDHAIEIDPSSADAYFVKASALYSEAAKHGRSGESHEATNALQKYLQLAPEGSYAKDASALLQQTMNQGPRDAR